MKREIDRCRGRNKGLNTPFIRWLCDFASALIIFRPRPSINFSPIWWSYPVGHALKRAFELPPGSREEGKVRYPFAIALSGRTLD